MFAANNSLKPNEALVLRLGLGLVIGLALGWLSVQTMGPFAPNHAPPLWQQIALITLVLGIFIPWAGAGAMRRISLLIWTLIAFSLIAFISWHARAHLNNEGGRYTSLFLNRSFLIFPFLFITHELISSADQAGKPIAPYNLYFDQAWKRGVQLALAVLFTVLFWAILWLGAALLGFIGFHWFKDLLGNRYFMWVATGLAMASAVNLGDVNTKLLSSVRALILGVMSWLLPVISLIGAIFAVSLIFSGLQPLWDTKAATVTLLSACIAMVLLINAAYQQGDDERAVHIFMKWSARIACLLLLVFAVLAAYSLYLRINQYGLTPERVLAAIGVSIAVLFGLGYSVAAIAPGAWLKRVDGINITLAIVKSVLFLAVLTPIADPARLSVASQVSRLKASKISVEKFDWKFLRFQSGSYGGNALEDLSQSAPPAIKAAALKAKAYKDDQRWEMPDAPSFEGKVPNPKLITVVSPKGATLPPKTLPQSFLAQKFHDEYNGLPTCMTDAKAQKPCSAALIDLNEDGKVEIVILQDKMLIVLNETHKGWVNSQGTQFITDEAAKAFAAGNITSVKPKWNDLMIGEYRRQLN